MDRRRRRCGPRWIAATQIRRDSGRGEGPARVAPRAARVVVGSRRNPFRIMKPPRLADWILARVLPIGKRGESIRGDLREEFRLNPSRSWYWGQTIRLAARYALAASPQ